MTIEVLNESGIAVDDIAGFVNRTTLFRNQWQFRPEGDEDDAAFKERVRNRFRSELADAREQDLLIPTVAYGFFPANGDGNDLVIWTDENRNVERARFPLPRQTKSPYLCIADFFRSVESGEPDYVSAQIATMGSKVSERTAELFLSLLGLPVKPIDVDLAGGEHKTPAYLALNCFGQVPVIQDGEVTVADSNAILHYLASRYGAAHWFNRTQIRCNLSLQTH